MRLLTSFIVCSFILCSLAHSQTIKVVDKDDRIEKMQRNGYSVLIQLEKSFVAKNWAKKVKSYGKAEISGDEYIVHQATMPEISSSPVKFYSKVNEKAKQGTEVWMAVDLGTEFVTKDHIKTQAAEKLLYQFAVETYQADIKIQIEEAETTLGKTTKEYEKSVAGEAKVKTKMQKNKEEKMGLLNEIKQNKVDSVQLVKDLEMNKLEQKQDSLEVVKMKKAVEVVKAKLTTVK